jgi:enamine deaminase RidA (YjgF/YER057c/UK114 family)
MHKFMFCLCSRQAVLCYGQEEIAMPQEIRSQDAPQPFSNYAQGIAIKPGARIVHVAGQVGARADGTIAKTPEEQHELCWANVMAILKADGMDHTNIVDAHVYITDRAHIGLYRETRDRMLKGHRAAATLLVVAGLAHPDLVVEVSAVAAKDEA